MKRGAVSRRAVVQDRTAALVRRIGSLSLLLDFVCPSPRALDVMTGGDGGGARARGGSLSSDG